MSVPYIIKASLSDEKALAALFQALAVDSGLDPKQYEGTPLRQKIQNGVQHRVMIARQADALIGFVFAHLGDDKVLQLDWLAVRHDWRGVIIPAIGSGRFEDKISNMLVRSLQTHAGMPCKVIHCLVSKDNRHLRTAFARWGFEQTATRNLPDGKIELICPISNGPY